MHEQYFFFKLFCDVKGVFECVFCDMGEIPGYNYSFTIVGNGHKCKYFRSKLIILLAECANDINKRLSTSTMGTGRYLAGILFALAQSGAVSIPEVEPGYLTN